MNERERRNTRPVLIIGGVVAFIIILGLISLKFFGIFNDNLSPQSGYEAEIDKLQKQAQAQLGATMTVGELSNEEVKEVIFNASLASLRLSDARYWVENENLVDAQRYLASAKEYLAENQKIINQRQQNTERGQR